MNDVRHVSDALLFCCGTAQAETHAVILSDGRPNRSPKAGQPYGGITGAEIARIVQDPPSVPKEQARWFIPSTNLEADARSHERQREVGAFWWLVMDVDTGNPSLDDVGAAVEAVLGDCRWLAYATRSAAPEDRRWRVLVPLRRPLSGAAYAETQTVLFDLLAARGIECDRALNRPGQLVYLPNRGEFYQYAIRKGKRLDLTPQHVLARSVEADRQARERAQRELMARRAQRLAGRKAGGEEGLSPVETFNARHDVADLLRHYGWTPSRSGRDFRSPFQTGRSFATRVLGEGADAMWVSLSSSDAGQGLGMATKNGAVAGDAFDLFCHFEHGGDMKAAVSAYGADLRQDSGPLDLPWAMHVAEATGIPAEPRNASSHDREAADPCAAAPWPAPDLRLLADDLNPTPELPLAEVLTPRAADWVTATAEGAGAPPDYVLLALLCVTGATMGNARRVSPWEGWVETAVIWGMCIGNPSAAKSPAIDAVLAPLRRVERHLRQAAQVELAEWETRQKLAKLAQDLWDKKARAALEKGNPPPPLPQEADAGRPPHIPRLVVNDATVERLGVIVQAQPKGLLQMRDELAGWLLMMEARNGGSDRAFWLEAYGGRGFTVERIGRDPLTIERLSIGVLGGIQPDRMVELLAKARDDGLLARFLPVWPARVPVKRPQRLASDALADEAMAKLTALQMPLGDDGEPRPWIVGFDDDARALMDAWRTTSAEWETEAEGLLLSFIGKLPGMAARLALVLAAIGYAFDGEADPAQRQITPVEFGRACHFLETYALPMARRAYGVAGVPQGEGAGRRLLKLIRAKGWCNFTTRQAMRAERTAFHEEAKLAQAIRALEGADVIRHTAPPSGPRGGRPVRAYDVNPAIWAEPA